MTLPLGSDPLADLLGQLSSSSGQFNPDNWLAAVDQPTIPPSPPDGISTRNEPNTVAAPPGAAASGGQIGLAIDAAMKYLGRPYQWGGNGQNGNSVDCSGLLYAAFKAAGFNIQRYRAVDYGHMGTPVDPNDARPGDIVYFNEPGDTDHVGIYLGNGKYIQAPQTGDVVKISQLGSNSGAQIRRIFPDSTYGGMPTTASGNFVVNSGGQRFVSAGKGAINDPVASIMALNPSTDPDALLNGLGAKGQLDKLMNPQFISGMAAAGRGNPVPATRDSHDFTPEQAAHGGFTVGQVHGLSEAEAYIIQHESGGDPTADNPTSTAFGIWQGLASTRAAYAQRMGFDPDTTDVNQQLQMFRQYISDRYGSAEAAEDFWRKNHWY
jgi:Cell wall-associated hydrolases (invasion-associated proteins)